MNNDNADSRHEGAGEYRFSLKIRNALIIRAIKAAGYSTVGAFCRAHGFYPSHVGDLVNMKKIPINKDGQWNSLAVRIADALNKLPEDLWTEAQRRSTLGKASYSIDVEESVALGFGREVKTPEQLAMEMERADVIEKMLGEIGGRHEYVLRRLFGFDSQDGRGETRASLAAGMGVSAMRVRQIEREAINKLRFSERRRQLLDVAPEYALG